MNLRNIFAAGLAGGLCCLATITSTAQTVEKVADLTFSGNGPGGTGVGGYSPLDRFTQVGTNLWFTTQKGGTFDAGTISRLELVTHQVVQVASFDNTTGKAAESSLLVIGDEAYFTTVNGGTGNKGTIAKVNLTNGVITPLHNFPSDSSTGATPRGGLVRINEELWTTTSLGGTSNRGVIVKYNLTNGVTTVVTNFDGPIIGGQPFAGFTPVGGNAWYFTTFSGGNTFATTGLPLGAGTLGRLTFDGLGNPVISRVVDLPGGYTQFPGLEPTPVGTNFLYCGTTGPNGAPGAIIRYKIDTSTWANVFSFATNSPATNMTTALGARPGYCGMTEWQGDIYFVNRLGGTSNLGAVVKFSIAGNTVTKLADLDGANGQALGSASGFFGSGTLVEETNRFFVYYPLTAGGVNNLGSIIRVALPPPPIQSTLATTAPGEAVLSWTGGYEPFIVQTRDDLTTGSWTNLFEGVTNRFVTLTNLADRAFFRVGGSQ